MKNINITEAPGDELYDESPVMRLAARQFGIKYLYPWQRLVIENILDAYNAQDDSFCRGRQIVILPTGAGKSLCFQIPAFIFDGPTLVIYPLLSLMSDQKRRMEEASLLCVTFRGGQSEAEREENFQKIKDGAKIILANPEVLQNQNLLEKLTLCGIKHLVIDEAHCVSEWGDSFRPAYLELGKILEKINPPVITAFTATASPEVLKRISEVLFGGEAHLVRSESDRPNIQYFVKKAGAKKKEALYLAQTEQRPMIFFCGTRDKCEDMAMELNVCYGRQTARFYHAGMTKAEKEETEKWFYSSKEGVLCATCAFGMGVNKQDIRTVIHLEAPDTPEAYIQEAGRAGRDGESAKAILLWSLSDSMKFSVFDSKSRSSAIKRFAETTECRRQVLLDALGDKKTFCSGCDLCNERNDKNRGKIWKIKSNQSDLQKAFNIFRKNQNFMSEEEIESELQEMFNAEAIKRIGKKIWNHSDVAEITAQLIESGKIRKKTESIFRRFPQLLRQRFLPLHPPLLQEPEQVPL